MLRIAIQNLFARRFRLISTALSVVIGVAFLAGSLVLIDTVRRTFDDLFAEVNENVDAEVRSADVLESDFGDLRGRIDAEVLDLVLAVPGVAAADGLSFGFAQLIDPDGDPLGNPGQGAPTLGFPWSDVDELNPMNLIDGAPPQSPTEVVIDAKSAKDGPFAVGDRVEVLTLGPPREFTIVGIARFGTADSPLGASVTLFEPTTAQEVLGEPGKYDAVDVVAEPGVGQEDLRDRIAAVLPPGVEVITGAELIEETQNDVAEGLSFFNTLWLIFSAVALFVASFIIYNTFSILVAQRTREMALLRALGARRGQILGSVVAEAVLVGAVASAIGIGGGVVVAELLKGLLALFVGGIPAGGTVFSASTVVTSMAVGVGVTLLAALIPSWRASTVAPMAAIRSVAVDESGHSRTRLLAGLALLVGGVALLWWGLFGDPPAIVPGVGATLAAVGLGIVFVFVGMTWLGPILAVPFSRGVGAPLPRLGGVPGELARENAMRNPRRTSTTAAALMIGVALVGMISIFAASATASINKLLDDSFVGDIVIDSGTFGFGGLSPQLATELNQLPEVQAASGVRLGFAEIDGETRTLYGVDPANMNDIVDVGVVEGRVEDLGIGDIAVYDEFAADRGWEIGTEVQVGFAATGVQTLTLSVIYEKDDIGGPAGFDFFVGHPAYEANFPDVFDFQVYVLGAPGVSVEETVAAVEEVAAAYPNAEVQDLDEFKQAQADQINQGLVFVYILLILAIIIALIGIANTLALSILERTQELGLLRAVGMTRRQLRASIRWESVLIALLGTTLGAVVGLFFGWITVRALESEGFTELRLPIGTLIVFVLIAAVAGVLAAVMPARRAARLDVLDAIAAE